MLLSISNHEEHWKFQWNSIPIFYTHWFYNNFHGFTINSFFSTSFALFNNITNIWGHRDHNRLFCAMRAQRFSEWKVGSQWAIEILMNIQKYRTHKKQILSCARLVFIVSFSLECVTHLSSVYVKKYKYASHISMCIPTSKCVLKHNSRYVLRWPKNTHGEEERKKNNFTDFVNLCLLLILTLDRMQQSHTHAKRIK